ncbi:hypothetical protein OSTOST_23594, partial [Ostertagia ostertagi]
NILADKAPEAIPLLEEFVSSLPSLSQEIVEAEKRKRSMVVFGVPEADRNLPPSQRQACTVSFVTGLLDVLNIEAHPVELYRMGAMMEDKPRPIKCVFSSRRSLLEVLSNARKLRNTTAYKDVYIRKSMSREERQKESNLRMQARELNKKEPQGKRTYVVYRGELVKVSDIPQIKKKNGGGVCVLIHSLLSYESVTFDDKGLKSNVICFDTLAPTRHRFLLVYRPPNSTATQDDDLSSIFGDLPHHHLGDLNLTIDWCNRSGVPASENRFLSIFDALSLIQYVDFPTRQDSVLDVVLSPPGTISHIRSLPPLSTSDHNMVSFVLTSIQKEYERSITRDYHHMNREGISYHLKKINWLAAFSDYNNIDDIYARFICIIHNLIEQFVPLKNIETHTGNYPQHILNLLEQRERIFEESSNALESAQFLDLSKELDRHLKRFLDYKVKKLAEKGNVKYLAAHVNKFLKQRGASCNLLGVNGEKYTTDHDKAEALADYFESVFTPAANRPHSTPNITDKCLVFPIITSQTNFNTGTGLSSDSIPQLGLTIYLVGAFV